MEQRLLIQLKGGLIVSCQAHRGEPLHGTAYMAKMALAAQEGGAVAVRGNGPEDIRAIKNEINLPVVGIHKIESPLSPVIITPDLEAAEAIIHAGADIVALDCTNRRNHQGHFGTDILQDILKRYNVLAMAEISILEEAKVAFEAGAHILSTTLSGYTSYSATGDGPDFALISAIRKELPQAFVNAEGRMSTVADVKEAFARGADTVTVGAAITRPQWITRQFARGCPTIRSK